MAPKSAQKTKAKAEEETTPPPAPKPKPKPSTPAKTSIPAKANTPAGSSKKKNSEKVTFRALAKDASTPVPVGVAFEGGSSTSKLEKGGTYSHTIKLDAQGAFNLVKTYVLQGGEYDGMQVILIRPAKAFDFMGLPEEVRGRVYRYYFAPNRIVGGTITLDGKRKSNSEAYAKLYADGSNNRVALLAVNKEIHEKAQQVLYSHNLFFESTSAVMEFLSNIKEVRPHLTSVSIKSWVKTTSKTAMGILAESPRITRLHIDGGVYNEGDPTKAAKGFYDQTYKFLEAVGALRQDPTAGVDVLSFGKQAFKYKDEKKVERPWSAQLVEEFKDNLRQKLSPPSP